MLTVVVMLVSFAWSFVYVGLPFYIEKITTVGPSATLAWTGWILGVTSLVSMATTPLWGRYGTRGDTRSVFVVVQTLQAVGFLAAALAGSLVELFLARFVLGAVGATSTLAFLLAGREPDPGERRHRLAMIQFANMGGQVLAPLVGAAAAARLGFRVSFLLAGLTLAGCAALLQWGNLRILPPSESVTAARHRPPLQIVAMTAAVVLVGSAQESFLTSVLPSVLPDLGVTPPATLEVGGMLVFVSGVSGAVGTLLAPRLADQVHYRRLVPALLAASSAGLVLLGAAGSVWLFTTLRIAQTLAIAPLFPLVVARIARYGGGEAIGILNAARAGGSFLAPVVATSLLTWGSPSVVYLLLGVAGLAVVPLTRR
jgi:MFS transporter, DHA1 family, multidrug resistance protein